MEVWEIIYENIVFIFNTIISLLFEPIHTYLFILIIIISDANCFQIMLRILKRKKINHHVVLIALGGKFFSGRGSRLETPHLAMT